LEYVWDFGIIWQYKILVLKGCFISLSYWIGTILGGLTIGLLCSMVLLSRFRWAAFFIRAYVEAFRCTPLLVQLIWIYYALPVILNVNIPAHVAASSALTLYIGAFYAEVFRGGVISIARGQWDAGHALGMSNYLIMKRIILPQAVKRMLPNFINQSVIQLKNTTLIYVLAVGDLLYQGSIITAATYRPLEIYTLVAIIFFVILYPLTHWAKRMEVKLATGE